MVSWVVMLGWVVLVLDAYPIVVSSSSLMFSKLSHSVRGLGWAGGLVFKMIGLICTGLLLLLNLFIVTC